MRKVYEYSHLGGKEILKERFAHIDKEIDEVIEAVQVKKKTKVSKEKTKRGRLLYRPGLVNRRFKKEFRARGWTKLKKKYTIELEGYPTKIKGAFKEINFFKDRILVEVQLGKYFAMFYDLAKFQYFYNEGEAELGVEIVPCHALKKQMSTGVSYGEQVVYDIGRLRRTFPAVPLKIILFDVS